MSLDPKICKICIEAKPRHAMFHKNSCSHCFCCDCISKHVTAKVQVNIVWQVTCPSPNCESIIQPEDCKYFMHGEVFDRWMKAHSETSCENFQMLGEDERGREDIMLMKLAKEKNWSRCPNCKYYIEKTDGCQHITCFYGYQFCYGCGIKWISEVHGGCQGPWRG